MFLAVCPRSSVAGTRIVANDSVCPNCKISSTGSIWTTETEYTSQSRVAVGMSDTRAVQRIDSNQRECSMEHVADIGHPCPACYRNGPCTHSNVTRRGTGISLEHPHRRRIEGARAVLTLAISRPSYIDSDTGADELRTVVRINDGTGIQNVSDVYRLFFFLQVADDIFGEENECISVRSYRCTYYRWVLSVRLRPCRIPWSGRTCMAATDTFDSRSSYHCIQRRTTDCGPVFEHRCRN